MRGFTWRLPPPCLTAGQDCTDPPAGYLFYQHEDSPGNDLEPKLEGTPKQMADKCSETAGFKGYTSTGVMKSALTYPLVDWANPGGDCDGIYILAAVTGTGELGPHV